MCTLTSELGDGRTFTLNGAGIISCDSPCAGLHMGWAEVPGVNGDTANGEVPVCLASDAPHVGEKTTFTPREELTLRGQRPSPRACTLMAEMSAVIVYEEPFTQK